MYVILHIQVYLVHFLVFFQVLWTMAAASQPHLQLHKKKFPKTAPSSIVITITKHLYSHNQILKIMLSLEYLLFFILSSLIFCPDDLACYWMYCGEGTCTNNGTYRYMCSCNPGFSNLLNISYYPCYSQCKNIYKIF